ncbi:hypothetical protein [Aquimarina sp. RZ0]|uniref:hypothetical protein n=1 Tax=Aquimarina sp. RZ0 TaxID=2607730 RepID=UPI0011F183BF|nr:hypothetical protein [Aquimarina sp. RZ0]KAA1242863.1 hypothetical protein F0000_23750 [Aquimarina sp. RZ0]
MRSKQFVSKLNATVLFLSLILVLTSCEKEENFTETIPSSKVFSNLTGYYKGSDRGHYYIRQIGNDIFWFGEDPSGIWANVFRGSLSGNTLSGIFYDVPKGINTGARALTFSVNNSGTVITKIFGPGFGGNVLTKSNRPSSLPGVRPQGFGTRNNINDLTAKWKASDGGSYYLRQLGNRIVWFGEQNYQSGLPVWANVAFGTRSGDTITLDWVDVPKGRNGGSGKLSLKVDNANQMSRVFATGGFGGRKWER